MSNLVRARQIFWDYACNHFHLDRDGQLAEYVEAGGCKEHEAEWRHEYILNKVAEAQAHDKNALFGLQVAEAVEAIPSLLLMEDFGDDYFRFWHAFTLNHLAKFASNSATGKQAKNAAIETWRELLSRPILIAQRNRHRVSAEVLEMWKAQSVEEYLRNYCLRLLEENSV